MAWALSYIIPFTAYPYTGGAVACDLCGATATEIICENDRRFKKLRTVACLRCGLLRTDPMPTAEEIDEYYQRTYRWDYQFAHRGPSKRHLMRGRREALSRLALLATALHPGARILDFGSGAGSFLGAAKEAGHDVLGVEPGGDYAAYAKKTFGVGVVQEPWEEIVHPLGTFDVITAVEVLEHLRKPIEALRWLAGRLAPDGVIYVTVPNALPNGKETFRRFHFAHLHNFTPMTLEWAAQTAGLELDPRFTPIGTRMVFRRAAQPTMPAIPENAGEGLHRLYPNDTIIRYVLAGGWLRGRVRQFAVTVRDTLNFS